MIQNAKRAEEIVPIRKVFLVDSDDELLTLSEHIEQQRQVAVEVHYLARQMVASDERLEVPLTSGDIPSIDFGIFDEEIVLVFRRSVADGHLHVDDPNVGAVVQEQLYERFAQSARQVCRTPHEALPTPAGAGEAAHQAGGACEPS